MNKKHFLAGLVTLGLLLMLISGIAYAQAPASTAGDSPTEVDVSIDAAVNSKISYQGMLTESSQPVTGSRDLLFRLYSNSTCTTQVGSDIVKNSVSITDGLFSIELPVTHSHFNGQGLWLRTRVGASTWLGCQELLPVPYALSLRPGAIIQGAPGANWLLEARTGTGAGDTQASLVGPLAAVQGVTSLGVGVYGEANGAVALSGVYGTSDHQDGAGGHFTNTGGGVALLVEGSGIIESSAETDIAVNPHNMVAYAESNVQLRPYVSYMEVRGNTVATELVYVPVDLPVNLFGTQTRLRNVNICYKCDLATSYLTYVAIREPVNSGGSNLVLESHTNRTATSWQCFDLTPASPYNLTGPLTLVLQMDYSASGSSHDIQIGKITVTLDE